MSGVTPGETARAALTARRGGVDLRMSRHGAADDAGPDARPDRRADQQTLGPPDGRPDVHADHAPAAKICAEIRFKMCRVDGVRWPASPQHCFIKLATGLASPQHSDARH